MPTPRQHRPTKPNLQALRQAATVWAGASAGSILLAVAIFRPGSCRSDDACAAHLPLEPSYTNVGAACGIATVLLHEVASLVLHYRTAKPLEDIVEGVMEVFFPSFLLCILFAVVALENVALIFDAPSLLISSPGADIGERGRLPVFSVTYLEWQISVPILIVLAGHCALGRSFEEIGPTIVVTNVYMVLAWGSYFAVSSTVRWSLIFVSFAMYTWASWHMVRWAVDFIRTERGGIIHTKWLRPVLCVGLVVVFGIYGAVFVASHQGWLTSAQERDTWTCLNVGVKLGMSMGFAGIRSGSYHELLVDMLVNTHLPFDRQVIASKTGMDFDDF